MKNHPPQNLIVFATGGTPASAETTINKMWSNNFSEAEQNVIPHFYIQSGLDYGKMHFVDWAIMKMVSKLMSGKKNKNEVEAGFEQAIKRSYDISGKEHIEQLVNFVKDRITCACRA